MRLQLAHDVLQVAYRARQSVDAGDHQRVASADEVEQRAQLVAPLGRCPAHLLAADDVAASRLERRELHVEVLPGAADASVADLGGHGSFCLVWV